MESDLRWHTKKEDGSPEWKKLHLSLTGEELEDSDKTLLANLFREAIRNSKVNIQMDGLSNFKQAYSKRDHRWMDVYVEDTVIATIRPGKQMVIKAAQAYDLRKGQYIYSYKFWFEGRSGGNRST